MKNPLMFLLISAVSAGLLGCSPNAEEAAAEARVAAADARTDAADADARVVAADAQVRAADAAVDAADAEARVVEVEGKPANYSGTAARVVIPSGTVLKVTLIDALDSDTSTAGDQFQANLSEAIVSDGATLLAKGTKVRGRVIGVEESGRVKGRASISLVLTDIVQGGRMIPITTGTHADTADSTQKRDAGIIAGGAGVGAAIGAIAGGKKGAAIGAATGGGAGTGIVLATKGNDVHYDPETRLNFTLTNSVQL